MEEKQEGGSCIRSLGGVEVLLAGFGHLVKFPSLYWSVETVRGAW